MGTEKVGTHMSMVALKAIAKEIGVVYRVGMSKVNLVNMIQEAQAPAPTIEEEVAATTEEPVVNLTNMEKMLLNGMRNNEYNDALAGAVYTFSVIDYSGLEAKQARGVISSLIKKGLIESEPANPDTGDDNEMLHLTSAGELAVEQGTGADCAWGGPKLFEVEELEQEEDPVREAELLATIEADIKMEESMDEELAAQGIETGEEPAPVKTEDKPLSKREMEEQVVAGIKNSVEFQEATADAKTKADAIRALLSIGYERKHIAKALDVRYQMVYQVEKRMSESTESTPDAKAPKAKKSTETSQATAIRLLKEAHEVIDAAAKKDEAE